jgi:inorganic pyrophosphatase
MIALIAVAVFGAMLGLFIMVRRKQPTEIKQTPAETFLADLQTAKDRAGQDIKKFQTELFKALVKYLESAYTLSAAGKPADVIVTELEKVTTDRTKASRLAGWLMRAEKEKYSPVAAAPGDVTRLEAEIRQFFENMK